MAIPHVLVLGGGFGGISTALAIRERLDTSQVRITLVDRRDWFMVGFAKLWIIRGSRTAEECSASLENLRLQNIDFVKADIKAIDINARRVDTGVGVLQYDYLVVALGAQLAPDLIPGLGIHGLNLYEHTDLAEIRRQLLGIRSGRVAIAITGMPYKCPPAPYEAALTVDSLLRETGVRKDVSIDVYGPAPITLPAAGPDVSARVLSMMQAEGIEFHGSHKVKSVERGQIVFDDDAVEPFDILLAVPPHRLPPVAASLASGPFIGIDRMGRTDMERVYAVGDITTLPAGEKPVPKAGIFAEGEGRAAASHIISEILTGATPEPFDGRGGCFMESGRQTASIVQVDAFAHSTTISEPTSSNLEAKIQFERDRLEGWLGGS